MAFQLVVKHPFGPYQVGDHITDQDLVQRHGREHPEYVVRKLLDDKDVPAPAHDAE